MILTDLSYIYSHLEKKHLFKHLIAQNSFCSVALQLMHGYLVNRGSGIQNRVEWMVRTMGFISRPN